MKTDRELLELAAKAAGITINQWGKTAGAFINNRAESWSPLTNDGDALRLAVKLRIEIERASDGDVYAGPPKAAKWLEQLCDHVDAYAAVRRAIVQAAASLGEFGNVR